MMAVNVLNMFLSVFQATISMFFNLNLDNGVSLGWIFIVVIIMFLLLKFFFHGGDSNG